MNQLKPYSFAITLFLQFNCLSFRERGEFYALWVKRVNHVISKISIRSISENHNDKRLYVLRLSVSKTYTHCFNPSEIASNRATSSHRFTEHSDVVESDRDRVFANGFFRVSTVRDVLSKTPGFRLDTVSRKKDNE